MSGNSKVVKVGVSSNNEQLTPGQSLDHSNMNAVTQENL